MRVFIDELAERTQALASLHLSFGSEFAALDLRVFTISLGFADPVVALVAGLVAIGCCTVLAFGLERCGAGLGFFQCGVEARLGFGAVARGGGVGGGIGHGSSLLGYAFLRHGLARLAGGCCFA